jgi:hypothetical protein
VNTHMKSQEAMFAQRQSLLGIFARMLAKWSKWVRGPLGPRAPRWHDSDGIHRGFRTWHEALSLVIELALPPSVTPLEQQPKRRGSRVCRLCVVRPELGTQDTHPVAT